MSDSRLFVDPAVDIVSGEGGLRFLAPGGSFALRDPHGLARALTAQYRDGAPVSSPGEADTPDDAREASHALANFLTERRIFQARDEDLPGHDPAREWLRHYAGIGDKQMPVVQLEGKGRIVSAIRENLSNVGASFDGQRAPQCLIAAFDTPDLEALRTLNVRAHDQDLPFLPVWMERSTVYWGPMTLPRATGCLECRLHRMHANQRRTDALDAFDLRNLTSSRLLSEMAAVLAVGELLRWVFEAHIETDVGVGWQFDWLTLKMSGRRVLRLPRCPVCGTGREALG